MALTDDFDFEGLGQKLTQTVLSSFNKAVKNIEFKSIGTGLENAVKSVDMSKVLAEPLSKGIIKLTKGNSFIDTAMNEVKKKIESSFSDIELKTGTIDVLVKYKYDNLVLPKPNNITIGVKFAVDKLVLPNIPTIPINIDTANAEKKLASIAGIEPTPVAKTTAAAPMSSINTGPLEKAGDLVSEFVALTQEANKKTEITGQLYDNLLSLADKLVATKRMERDEADKMMAAYQKKIKPSDIKIKASVSATVDTIDTTKVNDIDTKLEAILDKFSKTLVNIFKNINTSPLQNSVNKFSAGIRPTRLLELDGILSEIQELVEETNNLNLIQKALGRNSKDEYAVVDRRVRLTAELKNNSREELNQAASQLKLKNTAQLTDIQLALAIKNRIADLYREKAIREDLISATEDYNRALRQSNEDVRIKGLIVRANITEDEVAQLARMLSLENERQGLGAELTADQIKQLQAKNQQLRAIREEVELVERVAEYQKEVNQEVEKFSMKWRKIKATAESIFKNPAFAKAVLFGSLIQGAEKLTHSMHEFMDVGMTAGEGISATFRSTDIYSLMGLSKSSDVLKTMVQQYGNMNTLSKSELQTVGKMAASYGLAGDEALNLTMAISRMPGQTRESAVNFQKTAVSVAKMKGVMPSQIMKEMAKNSGLMATYSKGGAEGFAKAAASAKRMGVELSNVLNAAEKTLDFESSMNAQMEASVLLGREINMDRLRQAALSGDANAVLMEQQNLMRQAGGLENMNLLQKKKLSEAMGLSVEEMQKINDQAQFQNKYFGEQAGLMSNLLGYAFKYGEAFGGAIAQFGPLVASILSLIANTRMLNIVKLQNTAATAKDTGANITNTQSIISNNSAQLSSAAANNVNTLSTTKNTTATALNNAQLKAYRAARLAGIPATQALVVARNFDTTSTVSNTGAITSNTLATRISAAASTTWNGIKRVTIGLLRISGVLWLGEKLGALASAAATGISTAANTAWNVVKGVSITLWNSDTLVKIRNTVATKAGFVADAAWNGLKQIGNALMKTSAGLWLVDTIRKYANIGATMSLAGANSTLTATQKAATLSTGGFTAALTGLSAARGAVPVLLAIGAAVLLIGGGVYLAATGMANLVASFKGLTGPQVLGAVASLLMLNFAITSIVGTMALLAISGVGGAAALLLLSLGAAFLMIGGGIALAANGLTKFTTAVKDISGLTTQLTSVSRAIFSISKSLDAFAASGLKAVPALGVVSALSKMGIQTGVATQAPVTKSPTATATAPKAVAPQPGQIPTATATTVVPAQQQQVSKTQPAESNADMKVLNDKLERLIGVLLAGGTINMDGKKVADIVQRNIRTIIFQ